MREKKEDKQLPALPVYQSRPPEWLPKLHGSADLGYIGFHPPRPGQDEDGLSESNIKNGFILPHPVPVESFSAHAMINESLHSIESLTKLEELMNEVFIRRTDRIPFVPASSFRIPTRVTLNDAKRQAWFDDLANPDVPLYKLGKSVPHGAKGGDLLDLLHSNDVEISRAVWFLRVFGANETVNSVHIGLYLSLIAFPTKAGLRNKPSYVPTQHSIDWANVVTGHMKKQLLEIALPSAPRPLLNIKQTFKGVLADVDSRERWVSRFAYCLRLLRAFYKEDLVDHRTYLTWLVHQMITCNLAQAGFLVRLVDEYLGDILCSRALSKPLVEGLLAKLSEIRTTSARDILKDTEDLLKKLLQRNEALLFRDPIAQVSAHLETAVSDVKLLNSISANSDMGSISYFRQGTRDNFFKEKLDLLLTWSVTPLQYGDHRPFAAATLIRIWRDKARDRASRRDIPNPTDFLQNQLFDWLDKSEMASDTKNIRDVALLYGKLVKYEIFSFEGYIQRLIARGEELSAAQVPVSRHRLLLSWIPLFDPTPSFIHQRKVALHGSRAREFPEDSIEREIRKEIRAVLPDLFEATRVTISSFAFLLMKFDNGRYLDEMSRDRIASDIAAFTLALQPIVDQPDIVPDVLPEILLLAGDPDPIAPSILANSLWIKYRTSADWAWKVWDNTIASLRQIPSMTPDIEIRRAHALRYGDFLWRVDLHLPQGLDQAVLEWFLGPGKAEVVALTSDAWDVLQTVLLFLVIHDALKATTILQGLIYPAWQLGATWSSTQFHVSETYLSAANRLCFQILFQEDADNTVIPPTNLSDVQCIRTRRQAVYDEPHFPLLLGSVPALISLENNENLSQTLKAESTAIRYRLCQDPGFRRGAYRNLDDIRDAFENSPYLTDQDPDCGKTTKRAITGLNMILCDSRDGMSALIGLFRRLIPWGSESDVYGWPEATCLLTPWKIAATTIQMQLQVKQLSRALSHESTSECATKDLNKLVAMLFHHTKTAEEAYYVGEMARGADSNVAAKFINTGFQCMTEFLSESQDPTADCVRRMGDLLRVLVHVSQPCRDTLSSLPTVDSQIQESFAAALDKIFKTYETEMLNNDNELQERQNLVLLSRLLQFILSFKNNWTPKSKEIFIGLSEFIFRLALYCANEDSLDISTYPVLLDTLLVLYDEMQNDSKSATFDPFRYYPNISLNDLPSDMPPEYHKQIRSLLVTYNADSLVANLVNTHRDPQGNTVHGPAVVNKPWEWIESLGEPSVLDPKEGEREREEKDRLKVRHLVKNSGSVSLDNFAARVAGDGIKSNMLNDDGDVVEGCTRFFEDGLSENIFIRDWRESRLDFEPSLEAISHQKHELAHDALMITGNSQALRASPSSSVISRSSTTLSGLRQQQQSPALTIHNRPSVVREVVDMDTLPGTSMKGKESIKRKMTSMAVSDDEVEIIEGPVVTRTTSVKKQKGSKAPAAERIRTRKK
ncbi:hypothetical protein CPB84DRAFT_1853156 [Gymnopilus junonius]|uniref:Mediator of RNA polymerase II transcription subunit 12 n=1 Tax=Gymnopilus junonius TaxID=109634 RepID=A0A9P5N9P2_GYMJU|nr:hypothetical protein CPB84DRAFT_1853156 [Gymnopilus junonius]